MNGLHIEQAWRCRVSDLLDDPVAQAVLRRDGLSREEVMAQLAPVAEALCRRRRAGPTPYAHPQIKTQAGYAEGDRQRIVA